jgi:hypothetical protein
MTFTFHIFINYEVIDSNFSILLLNPLYGEEIEPIELPGFPLFCFNKENRFKSFEKQEDPASFQNIISNF